jgi:hypothetical protein
MTIRFQIGAFTLLTMLASAVPAFAQKQTDPGFTKEQNGRISALARSIDERMKPAFDADPKLRDAMLADLKQMEAIKDAGQLKAAIAKYQAKYAVSYREILKKSGVSLVDVARQFSAISSVRFEVVNGTHLVSVEPTPMPTPKPTPTPPSPPAARTFPLRTTDFTFTKDIGCGGGENSSATFSSLKLQVEGWAAAVGNCQNKGSATYRYDVPQDRTARATLYGSIDSWTVAVGVVGAATSSVWAKFDYREPLFCSSIAMFLWAAHQECNDAYLIQFSAGRGEIGRVLAIETAVHTTTTAAASPMSKGGGTAEIDSAVVVETPS